MQMMLQDTYFASIFSKVLILDGERSDIPKELSADSASGRAPGDTPLAEPAEAMDGTARPKSPDPSVGRGGQRGSFGSLPASSPNSSRPPTREGLRNVRQKSSSSDDLVRAANVAALQEQLSGMLPPQGQLLPEQDASAQDKKRSSSGENAGDEKVVRVRRADSNVSSRPISPEWETTQFTDKSQAMQRGG